MVAIATPICPAPSARPRRTAQVTVLAPTLTKLAEAQQAHNIFAHDLKSDEERLARLRRQYARKLAEYNVFCELFEESALDIEFRAGDGRQLTLRLSMNELGDTYAGLRDALSESLRSLEQEIVTHLQGMEQEAELLHERPFSNDSSLHLRGPILALCAPGI